MKAFVVFISIFMSTIFYSCSHSYIGSPINMAHPSICHCQLLPKTCEEVDKNFKIMFRISKIDGNNQFLVDGTATYIGSATWTSFDQANFTLFLLNNGRVVDVVNIMAGRGSLDKTIAFKREFTTEHDFMAVLLNYGMNTRG